MLQIRLFGVLTIERDGKALPLPASAQARGLLAYLASLGIVMLDIIIEWIAR